MSNLDSAALDAGLSLAARSQRQSLVSDGASLQADRNTRLRRRARFRAGRVACIGWRRIADLPRTAAAAKNERVMPLLYSFPFLRNSLVSKISRRCDLLTGKHDQ